MPWNETVTMQRLEFILACQSGEESITSICRRFNISRKTAYKWLARYSVNDVSSLQNLPRARHTQSGRLDTEITQYLLNAKMLHRDWGAKKIRSWLLNQKVDFIVPASSTIAELFKRHALVMPQKRGRSAPQRTVPLTEVTFANQVWSADFKGKYRLLNGKECHPFTLTDNFTRYLLACQGSYSESEPFVRKCLENAFYEAGMPEVIRTDNGSPFAGAGLKGLSYLSIWLIKLGIKPERIKKGCPTENGRHERMHRSLWWSLSFGNIGDDLEGQQRWFDQYRKEFNLERPHEALGGKPPQEVWVRSPVEYDGKLPKVEYPSGEKICFVSTHGNISVNGRQIFLSASLRGEYVWLEEVDGGRYLIRFCQMPLAYYDPKKNWIIGLENG
jgi:putative transposase